MFDLDEKIAAWRRRMISGGLRSEEILDELESHMRDDFERRVDDGAEPGSALETTLAEIGEPGALRAEFQKTLGIKGEITMQRKVLSLLAFLIMMVVWAIVLPAIAHRGFPEQVAAVLFVASIIAAAAGVYFFGFRSAQKQS